MLTSTLKDPRTWLLVVIACLVALVAAVGNIGAGLNPRGVMHNFPLVLANEDTGAALNGQNLNLGAQITSGIAAPKAGNQSVRWTVVRSRDEAVRRIHDNKAYGGLVIPKGYTARLMALAAPGSPPAPVQVEILTAPAAGTVTEPVAEGILRGIVTGISKQSSGQAVSTLSRLNINIPAASALVIADPVQAQITAVTPVGSLSAGGLTPLYLGIAVVLAGFLGVIIITQGIAVLRAKTRPDLHPTWLASVSLELVVILGYAVLAGILQTWLAVSVVKMDAPHAVPLALFMIFGIAAVALLTLLCLTAFGYPGLLVAATGLLILGFPTSGGVTPLQMVPAFYRALASFLPLRYVVDGLRSILFLNGRRVSGLQTALFVLTAYLLVSAALTLAVARVRDLHAKRARPSVIEEPTVPIVEEPAIEAVT